MDEQQEQQERAKLLDFGLTSDVVDIVIAKKKELERKRSCLIIPNPEPIPIPIPIQETIDIIPEPEIPVVDPEPEIPVVEIKEEPKVEIKENVFYGGMPIWKRRLLERTYK